MPGQDSYMLHLNHRSLLGATCNLFFSKLKCTCEAPALLTMFVGHHLQKDSSEISSVVAVKTCSALPGYMSWSQTLVNLRRVMTTCVRSHVSYTEHSYTPCSVLFSSGGWKRNIEDGERFCSLGDILVCQTTKTQLLTPPWSLAEVSMSSAMTTWS